jgi:hypothetical protein
VKFVPPSGTKPLVADLNARFFEFVLNDLDIGRTASRVSQNYVRSEFKQQVKQELAFAQKLRQHDERETFQPPLPTSNLLLRLDNPSPQPAKQPKLWQFPLLPHFQSLREF